MWAEECVVKRSRVRPEESVTRTLPPEYRLPAEVRKRTWTPGNGTPPRFWSRTRICASPPAGGRREGSAQAATITSSGALSTGRGGGGESGEAGGGGAPWGPRRITLHPVAGPISAAARRRVAIPGRQRST